MLNRLSQIAAVAAVLLTAAQVQAAVIGVIGPRASAISSVLTGAGHTTVLFSGFSASNNAADYVGLDAFVLERTTGSAALSDFVTGGGTLVTEWDSSAWALNTASLLDADDVGGSGIGVTDVTFTADGLAAGLGTGVPNPYSESGGTQFFRFFANIGADVQVLATRPGAIPVALGGASGLGNTVILGYDWADVIGPNNSQVLLNAVGLNFASDTVPAPGALLLLGVGLLGLGVRRRTA